MAKERYEKPELIDMGRQTHGDQPFGDCKTGTSANGACHAGTSAGGNCITGIAAFEHQPG